MPRQAPDRRAEGDGGGDRSIGTSAIFGRDLGGDDLRRAGKGDAFAQPQGEAQDDHMSGR